MKLDILLICKTMPWNFKGGIQTHTWELGKAINKLGHNVTILTGGPFRSEVNSTFKEGIEIVSLPYFPGRYIKLISIAAEEISFNWYAKNWVKENHERFDIIHAQGRSGYLLYTVKAIREKLLSTVHGLIEMEIKSFKWYNFDRQFHKILARIFEKRLMKASKLNISVSKSLKAHIDEFRGKDQRISVIPNGVQGGFETHKLIIPKQSRFLFVGRLHPVKGIAPIVEQMKNAGPNIILDIIGGGPQEDKIKKIINENGLKDRVRLLGERSNEEIHEIMETYQGLILPSHYETQGIVLLEANAHAVPVIASDIPAIRETVKDKYNGILCDHEKPEEFIRAMKYISEHPLEAHKMGINGILQVEESYTWDKIATRTINTYTKISA